MKKNLVALVLCSLAFGAGFGLNNVAFSDMKTAKVAYVDVSKLLAASKTIKSAEEARAKQTKDMLAWYNTASADIKKQSTKAGKDALIKKYEAQLTQKELGKIVGLKQSTIAKIEKGTISISFNNFTFFS